MLCRHPYSLVRLPQREKKAAAHARVPFLLINKWGPAFCFGDDGRGPFCAWENKLNQEYTKCRPALPWKPCWRELAGFLP